MTTAMTLQFWGVRGSIPAPGPTTVRYGGNTACVSVDLGHGTLLVLDAGTGSAPWESTWRPRILISLCCCRMPIGTISRDSRFLPRFINRSV